MICKRCDGCIPDNATNRAPYCRHCFQAIKSNKLWESWKNVGVE